MAEIEYHDRRFWWAGDGEEKLLLDCSSCLDNKSSVSVERLPGQEFPTISGFILDIYRKAAGEGGGTAFFGTLAAVLLANRLMCASRPVRVLEYGCGDGRLSAILAETLGTFHERSVLVCACDALDENAASWLERMERTAPLPRLNYLAGDYGGLELPEHAYDCVVVNGTADFPDPAAVIRDAQRLVRSDGDVFCCLRDAPLVEDAFKLYYPKQEQYAPGPDHSLLTAKAADYCGPAPGEDTAWESGARAAIGQARKLLGCGGAERGELARMEETLKRYLGLAVRHEHAALKTELLDAKEKLLDRMVWNGGDAPV